MVAAGGSYPTLTCQRVSTPNPALKRTRRQQASLPVVVPSVSCHRNPQRAARRLALRWAALSKREIGRDNSIVEF